MGRRSSSPTAPAVRPPTPPNDHPASSERLPPWTPSCTDDVPTFQDSTCSPSPFSGSFLEPKIRESPVRETVTTPGGRGREVFYSTGHTANAVTILQWFSQRWSIEVTFRESKQHLGFQEPQSWTRKAVERTAPVAMLLYGLIVYWFATTGHKNFQRTTRPWYTRKRHASFREMLATLRHQSLTQQLSQLSLTGPVAQKLKQTLQSLVLLNV